MSQLDEPNDDTFDLIFCVAIAVLFGMSAVATAKRQWWAWLPLLFPLAVWVLPLASALFRLGPFAMGGMIFCAVSLGLPILTFAMVVMLSQVKSRSGSE